MVWHQFSRRLGSNPVFGNKTRLSTCIVNNPISCQSDPIMILTFQTKIISKFRRLNPTRSRLTTFTSAYDKNRGKITVANIGKQDCLHEPVSVMTVKGISVSSTRQFTVGIMKAVEREGTPLKPSSRNGISNSKFKSLRKKTSQSTSFVFEADSKQHMKERIFAYPKSRSQTSC